MWLWVVLAVVVCLFSSSSSGSAVWVWYENRDDKYVVLTDAQLDVVKKVEARMSVSNCRSIAQSVINDLTKLRQDKNIKSTTKSYISAYILFVNSVLQAYETFIQKWSGKIRIVKKEAFGASSYLELLENSCMAEWENKDGSFDYAVNEMCLGVNNEGLVWNPMPYVPPIAADFTSLKMINDPTLFIKQASKGPYMNRIVSKDISMNRKSILSMSLEHIVKWGRFTVTFEEEVVKNFTVALKSKK